jgi:hypothetical protein
MTALPFGHGPREAARLYAWRVGLLAGFVVLFNVSAFAFVGGLPYSGYLLALLLPACLVAYNRFVRRPRAWWAHGEVEVAYLRRVLDDYYDREASMITDLQQTQRQLAEARRQLQEAHAASTRDPSRLADVLRPEGSATAWFRHVRPGALGFPHDSALVRMSGHQPFSVYTPDGDEVRLTPLSEHGRLIIDVSIIPAGAPDPRASETPGPRISDVRGSGIVDLRRADAAVRQPDPEGSQG